MRLLDFALLADENINPEVIAWLRSSNADVLTTGEAGLAGRPDDAVLAAAAQQRRVVITHDRDFGKLAVAEGRRFTGIQYCALVILIRDSRLPRSRRSSPVVLNWRLRSFLSPSVGMRWSRCAFESW